MTGWTTVSTGDVYDLQGFPVLANQDNEYHLEDFSFSGDHGGGTVYQILTTSFVPGTTYTLTAYAGPEIDAVNTYEIGDIFFIANSAGTVLNSTLITATTNDVFTQFTVPFTSTGLLGDTGAIEIGFHSPLNSAQSDMEIDNFSLTAVPEPGSIAIVALGGFGLLGFVRRRLA